MTKTVVEMQVVREGTLAHSGMNLIRASAHWLSDCQLADMLLARGGRLGDRVRIELRCVVERGRRERARLGGVPRPRRRGARGAGADGAGGPEGGHV